MFRRPSGSAARALACPMPSMRYNSSRACRKGLSQSVRRSTAVPPRCSSSPAVNRTGRWRITWSASSASCPMHGLIAHLGEQAAFLSVRLPPIPQCSQQGFLVFFGPPDIDGDLVLDGIFFENIDAVGDNRVAGGQGPGQGSVSMAMRLEATATIPAPRIRTAKKRQQVDGCFFSHESCLFEPSYLQLSHHRITRTGYQQVGGNDRISKAVVALVDRLDDPQSTEEAPHRSPGFGGD